jgi:hypothetical protein
LVVEGSFLDIHFSTLFEAIDVLNEFSGDYSAFRSAIVEYAEDWTACL